jgi:hypothetical protein
LETQRSLSRLKGLLYLNCQPSQDQTLSHLFISASPEESSAHNQRDAGAINGINKSSRHPTYEESGRYFCAVKAQDNAA